MIFVIVYVTQIGQKVHACRRSPFIKPVEAVGVQNCTSWASEGKWRRRLSVRESLTYIGEINQLHLRRSMSVER